ncbi:TPA: hypothetical protein KE152_001308 [Klebsiella oxytoca]|nr:hypothetical protein [Klebsiella oxytoca]
MNISDNSLTKAFIQYKITRDGYLYAYARKLFKQGGLNALSSRERAYMGMSHWQHFYNYTEKLVKAGLAVCEYDEHGGILYVSPVERDNL